MPGIAGILGRLAPVEGHRHVRAMIGSMVHMPSYVSGVHCDPDLGVYAGWVAIAGSSASRQSISGVQGKASVLVAGECFASFARGATTPLAVHAKYGEAFAAELDGSFSGLLVEPDSKRAFLFNDRFGAERIYYHETGDALYFASEAKALLSVLPHLREFDEQGVVQYLTYGSTLLDRTLFRGINVMPPGSIWTFDRASVTKRCYFVPADWRERPELSGKQFRERLAEEFPRAVQTRMGSDETLGISITGGLDTRMIMACLPQTRRSPICYTFAGIDGETLDVRLGRQVAQLCGLEHRVMRIEGEFLVDYGEFVDRTVFITDGCAGALGAHEIYLNALASQVAPVRVTGNFGSEILRGMSTFKTLDLSEEFIEAGLREQIVALRSSRATHETHPAVFAAFHEIPTTHFGIPAAARSQLTFRSPFLSNAIVELAVRAPESERASAAACGSLIEAYNPALGRIPTDRGVVPRTGSAFRPWSRLFAEITFKLDYWHKEGLPTPLARLEPLLGRLSRSGLLGLHKFLPYRGWFRKELSDYVRRVLTDESTRRMPWWNADSLERLFLDHQNGRRNHLREINAVLTLEAVQRGLLRDNHGHRGRFPRRSE